jgi:8-hydroxy-5-deazaflavin:NADPH oxidoreductase
MTSFARIGIIGSGPVGRAVASHAVAAGLPVLISNSRGPDSLRAVVADFGPLAAAVPVAEAAQADLVTSS